MATTAKGTPYVVSTDLVANYPTVSSDLATHIDAKLAYNAVTINAQTGSGANAYTFALADASEGKLVTASNAATATYTVPPQSSVTWADGAVLRILNQGAGVVTIAGGAGVTINGTPLTLAQYKGAAIQRTASNTWTFVPFSGGVGNAAISDTPTGSYTGYQYWTYTASGTLNVTTAGFADILVIGGGGAGGGKTADANNTAAGGGGAGGYLSATSVYLPSGALTVTVGAGGSGNTNASQSLSASGNGSRLGDFYFAPGGGYGGGSQSGNVEGIPGGGGGSGGGGNGDNQNTPQGGATVSSTLGNNGGSGGVQASNNAGGGGGGGASAAGTSASVSTSGAGGNGTASSITGSSVTRAGGGGGGAANTGAAAAGGTGGGGAGGAANTAGTAGTANTGGGGGGAGFISAGVARAGGNGGSGVVIIRVAV